MITLFTFGRRFGLPDPSPFVVKAEVLLKMAGVPYNMNTNGFRNAPKGKLPYIEEHEKKLGDSTFIRFYLEEKHGADFDKPLSKQEKAVAWAFEKMCEEHLYWSLLDLRWLDDNNFYKGVATFFQRIPFPVRPFIIRMLRGKIKKGLWSQGFGRHSKVEMEQLAIRDLDAIAAFLGEKKYFFGEKPVGADATIFAFVSGALCPQFDSPIRTAAERHANLCAYSQRMMQEFYPELATPTPQVRAKGRKAVRDATA